MSLIKASERIFCNRSLNMTSIKAIGFDMDYTLALYKEETFENVAYESTLKKLVALGYPNAILKLKFDSKAMIRGLVIDKNHGNILKIDRHRYVKIAYHGVNKLSSEQRREIYDLEEVVSYEEPNFALIDTLFTLGEALLFMQLVDLKNSSKLLSDKSYAEIFKDIRVCLDKSHRDGSIKDAVAENPEKFIHHNPHFLETLDFLKKSDKKLFIATNSLWDYANVVMNYLCFGSKQKLSLDWLEYFDIVITGAQKPAFFKQVNPIFSVDVNNNSIHNCDGIDLSQSKVYQGGYYKTLHHSLGIRTGSEVLYVGDHIYGDIVRSKKVIGWRTMIVIQELEKEINMLQKLYPNFAKCEVLTQEKYRLQDEIHHITDHAPPQSEKKLVELEKRLQDVRATLNAELNDYTNAFHPVWGAVMKTGNQNSRFAAQVESYACLYTSDFTNLRHYSPKKVFKAPTEFMPHDPVQELLKIWEKED